MSSKATAKSGPQGTDPQEYVLTPKQLRYLEKIRKLKAEYKAAQGFAKKGVFVRMIHTFMQDLCAYPEGAYTITTAAYGDESVGSYPHVVPIAYFANPTLFYFTASENEDDVQDLWTKHAQVYLQDPFTGDTAFECSTDIVVTNFITIDGARRDRKDKEKWHIWSASDIRGSRLARINLQDLEKDEALDPGTSEAVVKRLNTITFQAPPDLKQVDPKGHKFLADVMRRSGHSSLAYSAKEKRGEGPLDLPIYGIEEIVEKHNNLGPAALLQTEVFDFKASSSGLIKQEITYKSKPPVDKNLLICGDNIEVMKRLRDEHGAFLDLIYIDPPFCSDRDYNYNSGSESNPAFTDIWKEGLKTYLPWMNERLILMHSLLKETGVLCVHVDYRTVHYLKAELDKIFPGGFIAEYIWRMFTPHNSKGKQSPAKNHQNLLFYAVSKDYFYRPFYLGYRQEYLDRARKDPDGRLWVDQNLGKLSKDKIAQLKRENRVFVTTTGNLRRKQFLDEMPGEVMGTVVTGIDRINSQADERTGYDTQKPEELLQRIIHSFSPDKGFIADFFLGSGTTCVTAQKLGRRWIGVDANPQAVEVAADRIRRISIQDKEQIGIKIENFKAATKVGYRKMYSSRYQREDVRKLDDSSQGRELSEFKHFILDCYISREGRKGDASLHGFRTERGQEVAIFVGPNSGETTRTFVVECLEAVGRRAKSIQKVEILGWSFSPSLIRSLERLAEDHDVAIELKKIHVFALRIEDALRSRNVRFIPAARATIETSRTNSSLNCELKLSSPISEIQDVHWFIYSETSTDLERIEYNFINDETLEDDETSEPEEAEELSETSRKKKSKELGLTHTFKGIKDGEYRIYVRITDRRGHPTAIIENIRVAGKSVTRISEIKFNSTENDREEAA